MSPELRRRRVRAWELEGGVRRVCVGVEDGSGGRKPTKWESAAVEEQKRERAEEARCTVIISRGY